MSYLFTYFGGAVEVPADVYLRAQRYKRQGVRLDYLEQYCEYHRKKAVFG